MFNAAPAPAVPIYYHHAHSGNQPAPIYKFVCRERLQRPVSAAEGRAEEERRPHGAVTDADQANLMFHFFPSFITFISLFLSYLFHVPVSLF